MECQSCGRANPAESRFCGSCGAALPAARPLGRRATVTIVFCDAVADSAASPDPEVRRYEMARFFELVSGVLSEFGGTVEKYVGDPVMAVFGVPVLHEDDALRALRAVNEIRSRVDVTVGVNTGEVLVGSATDAALVTGDVVNVAARLREAAQPGEVIVGPDTYRLARTAGHFEPVDAQRLRGRAGETVAYRMVDLSIDAELVRRDLTSTLVGRQVELLLLEHAYHRSVADSTTHLFTVLGGAGVGKSRLVAELTRTVARDALLMTGRCLPYGQGITFWPVVEMMRQVAHFDAATPTAEMRQLIGDLLRDEPQSDVVIERLLHLVGRSEVATAPEETAWAVRKLFEAIAAEQRVVALFDDIHWAEPTLLDLITHLADWSRSVPMLLVCMARPDLLETRPSWGGGMPNTTTIQLHPLSDDECVALVGDRLGSGELDAALRDRLLEMAEGNPLFLEQTLSMLVEEGGLHLEDGQWVLGTGELAVPPTIHAIVSARLDGLPEPERHVVEAASVIGVSFDLDQLGGLVTSQIAADLDRHVGALVRRELLVPERAAATDAPGFRFRHLLIRDAAYRSIPKWVRADLHERFGAYLDSAVGARARELEEIVGYHLEQAYSHRSDLVLGADRSRILAENAAERLGSAGRRALDRDDFAAAANLLGRAVALLDPEAPDRTALLPHLGTAQSAIGQVREASSTLEEELVLASSAGDSGVVAHVTLLRVLLQLEVDPEGAADFARIEARRLIPEFEQLGDDLSLARCWRLLGNSYHMRCQAAAAEDAFARALRHALAVGDRSEQSDACAGLLMMARRGPRPVPDALRRCADMADQVAWRQTTQVTACQTLAALHAMRGEFGLAREQTDVARQVFDDLGLKGWSGQARAYVELLAGDLSAAESELRAGYDALERLDKRGFLATQSALLAQVVFARGGLDEAQHLAGVSRGHAAKDDVDAQVGWRSVEAKVLAHRGEAAAAEDLARAAVRLAETTDYPILRADAQLDLAEVLAAVGDAAGARSAVEQALLLLESKGNLVRAAHARGRAAAL